MPDVKRAGDILANPINRALGGFFDDVPGPSVRLPVLKGDLPTPHSVKHLSNFKPITDLASGIGYVESQATERAQTVYMLIDEVTPAGAEVEPMLADAYNALIRAARHLQEAETHILRYANRLEATRLAQAEYAAEMFAEHGNPSQA